METIKPGDDSSNRTSKLGDDLISDLNELRRALLDTQDRLKASGVERTQGLKDNLGDDCIYYKKSLDLFLQKDYQDLKNLVARCHQLFEQIEGK